MENQDILNFTVQIRDPENKRVFGTGFVVSTDPSPLIITAAHVIKAILGTHPRFAIGAEVGVYFPKAENKQHRPQHANVSCCFSEYDDDVILLQLSVPDPRPFNRQNYAILGAADGSERHQFISYGFPFGERVAGRALGTILGEVTYEADGNFYADPVSLASAHIDEGFSGAAVLDVERNLVVGMVMEIWRPKEGNPRNADISLALNAKILAFSPFKLDIRDDPLEKSPGPQPKFDFGEISSFPQIKEYSLGKPDPVSNWVGRDALISALLEDWKASTCRGAAIVGFGGEGKSSLASRFLIELKANNHLLQPDGIFWWGFYDNRNVEEFFEKAIIFLTGSRDLIDLVSNTSMRVEIVAKLLSRGHYLFVLDGFEVMQDQSEDQYGQIVSPDLRAFLEFVAAGSQSFVLITSRTPLVDLYRFVTTFKQYDLDRLSIAEGRTLLSTIGLVFPTETLDKIIQACSGHALTLTIAGAYLLQVSVDHIDDIDSVLVQSLHATQYEKVSRLLRYYDKLLSPDAKSIIQLISCLRSSVDVSTLLKVYRQVIAKIQEKAFLSLIKRLQDIYLIQISIVNSASPQPSRPDSLPWSTKNRLIIVHPLIRLHYASETLTEEERLQINLKLAEYVRRYRIPTEPKSLQEIRPLMDEMYYLCEAKHFEEAYQIFRRKIDPIGEFSEEYADDHIGFLTYQLVAIDTELNLLKLLFPEGDLTRDPQLNNPGDIAYILLSIGLDYDYWGQLDQAISFHQRAIKWANEGNAWRIATWACHDIAMNFILLGRLEESIPMLEQSLQFADKIAEGAGEIVSYYVYKAYVYTLLGDITTADEMIGRANEIFLAERENEDISPYLSYDGILVAEILLKKGDYKDTLKKTKKNLSNARKAHGTDDVIRCERILGSLYYGQHDYEKSISLFDQAVANAERFGLRQEQVLSHLGRGKAYIDVGKFEEAHLDIERAMELALSMQYLLFYADALNALAKLLIYEKGYSMNTCYTAEKEIHKALVIAQKSGYAWAEGDSLHLLGEIECAKGDKARAAEYFHKSLEIRQRIGDVNSRETIQALKLTQFE